MVILLLLLIESSGNTMTEIIYLVIGVIIIMFLFKTREWREKAIRYDRSMYSKNLIGIPSMKEIIQTKEEKKWDTIFRSFFHQGKEFVVWVRRKRRIIN